MLYFRTLDIFTYSTVTLSHGILALGASRYNSDEDVWAAGESIGYESWCEGQPNGSNDPGYLWNENDFCWADLSETREYGYICELPANVV